MNVNGVKEVVMTLARKQCPIAPMLWGKPGIAKTAVIEEIANELGYRFFPLILSQIESVDLLGLMYMHTDKDGDMVTDYREPKWFKDARKNKKFILFLDEFNRGRPEVIKAAFTLVNERRLNGITLPPEVVIVAACNPDDDKNHVTGLDEALIDRFMHIRVTPSSKVWLDWASRESTKSDHGQNVHPNVVNFIMNHNEALFKTGDGDMNIPVAIEATPRSWERASRIHSLGLDASLEMECLRGIVGQEYALAFRKSLEDVDKAFTPEEIFELSDETIKRVKKYTNVASTTKSELLKASITTLEKHIRKNKDSCTPYAENVFKFIKLLPKDLKITAIVALHEIPKGWARMILADPELEQLLMLQSQVLDETINADKASKANANKNKR